MIRSMALAAAILAMGSGRAFADQPLPIHLHEVKPRLRFEGIEDYPDKVFYLRVFTYGGNPSRARPRWVEVKDSDTIVLNTSSRLESVRLLAIDRAEFERRSRDDASLDWLESMSDDGAELKGVSNETLITFPRAPRAAFRVRFADGRVIAEPIVDWFDHATTAAAIAAAAALAWMGVRWARRRAKSTASPNPSPAGSVSPPSEASAK